MENVVEQLEQAISGFGFERKDRLKSGRPEVGVYNEQTFGFDQRRRLIVNIPVMIRDNVGVVWHGALVVYQRFCDRTDTLSINDGLRYVTPRGVLGDRLQDLEKVQNLLLGETLKFHHDTDPDLWVEITYRPLAGGNPVVASAA